MDLIREVMLVRYRELYGTTFGDPGSVVHAKWDEAFRSTSGIYPGAPFAVARLRAGLTLRMAFPLTTSKPSDFLSGWRLASTLSTHTGW